MKFRTDFVTNSSSMNYFYECWITYKDSSIQEIYGPEEYSKGKEIFSNLYNPYSEDDIDTFDELLTRLLFMEIYSGLRFDEDDIDNSLFPVMIAAFLFFAGKKSFSEMIDYINDFISEESPEWEDNSDIQELLAINPDDYDESGLLEYVYEKLNEIFETDGELNEDLVEWYVNLSKENRSLSDVISLSFSDYESNHGEFVNPEIEYLYKKFGEDEPTKTSKEDPLYEKERNKWDYFINFYLKNDYYTKPYYDISVEELNLDIDKGLQTGWFKFMIDSVVLKRTEDQYFGDDPQTIVFSEDDRSILEEDGEYPGQHAEVNTVVLPEGLQKIGTDKFRNWRHLETINIPDSVMEIGSFAFDGSEKLSLSQMPSGIQKIGLTCQEDILQYALQNNLVKDISEKEFFTFLDRGSMKAIEELFHEYPDRKELQIEECHLFYFLACQMDQYGPNTYENQFFTKNPNHDFMRLLADYCFIPKSFTQYPITDLLEKAMKHDANVFLDILLSTGLELRFEDLAHFIHNDTLETLYPLFDKGLKIEESAYDDLITYASEHGKPEYTAWLLNRKNEDAQKKDAIE